MVGDERSEEMVERLDVVASPSRIELLLSLRDPKPIGDIDLKATGGEGSSDRSITREGVRHHIDKLRDAELVRSLQRGSGEGRAHVHASRPEKVYELAEALRALAADPPRCVAEAPGPITWEADKTPGPTLRVVHGAEVGRHFSLSGKPSQSRRGWVVGRGPEVDILIDWDPNVGEQAAEILHEEDSYELVDLRTADRRVALNGVKLDRGQRTLLSHGDLIGVGSTVLAFHHAGPPSPQD